MLAHQCVGCGHRLPSFAGFFDSGALPRYLRVLKLSDSRDCGQQLGKELDIIYEAFNPTNIIQMREYVLTVIGNSLRSLAKGRDPLTV